MRRFIEGEDRSRVTLLPECLDDYIGQDNPARVVDAFVEELELRDLGFIRTVASPPAHRPDKKTMGWHLMLTLAVDARRRQSHPDPTGSSRRPARHYSNLSTLPS
jgi:hypothetical protein